jgi:peptide/nickel transport system ATP-binding protein
VVGQQLLLQLSNVCVEYSSNGQKTRAVNKVSLDFPSKGYTLGVVGESGSGKTTLGMSIMNAIEPPGKIISGEIIYQGQNILALNKNELRKYRWKEVAMVYQSAMNSLNPVKKISDHIIEILQAHIDMSRIEARAKSLELLAEVGIKAERADDYAHQLSGGMRQRVVIAMALALEPKLLIADEPTSALDVVVQRQILQLLKKEIVRRQLSLIFITHEIAILNGLVENIAVMYGGEIVEQGPISQVLFTPKHPYTEMLLGSLLKFGPSSGATMLNLSQTTGDSVGSLPKDGCIFANRCKYAFDRCWTEKPLLKEMAEEGGRLVACHKYN